MTKYLMSCVGSKRFKGTERIQFYVFESWDSLEKLSFEIDLEELIRGLKKGNLIKTNKTKVISKEQGPVSMSFG